MNYLCFEVEVGKKIFSFSMKFQFNFHYSLHLPAEASETPADQVDGTSITF